MRFLLLAQEAHTLPYAIYIDEQTVESVMNRAMDMANEELRVLFRPAMLVDLEDKKVYRVVGNPMLGYRCIDDAETQNMGRNTEADYFKDSPTVGGATTPEHLENYSEGETQ